MVMEIGRSYDKSTTTMVLDIGRLWSKFVVGWSLLWKNCDRIKMDLQQKDVDCTMEVFIYSTMIEYFIEHMMKP